MREGGGAALRRPFSVYVYRSRDRLHLPPPQTNMMWAWRKLRGRLDLDRAVTARSRPGRICAAAIRLRVRQVDRVPGAAAGQASGRA